MEDYFIEYCKMIGNKTRKIMFKDVGDRVIFNSVLYLYDKKHDAMKKNNHLL